MKKVIKVVGAILIDPKNKKILCAQRGPGRSLANLWEFPGGKIEPGETPREALKRELSEELIVDVDVDKEIFEMTSYEYDFGIVELTTYICHLKLGTPKITEHIAIKWLPNNELDSLNWAPADIPAVRKLIHHNI